MSEQTQRAGRWQGWNMDPSFVEAAERWLTARQEEESAWLELDRQARQDGQALAELSIRVIEETGTGPIDPVDPGDPDPVDEALKRAYDSHLARGDWKGATAIASYAFEEWFRLACPRQSHHSARRSWKRAKPSGRRKWKSRVEEARLWAERYRIASKCAQDTDPMPPHREAHISYMTSRTRTIDAD